MAEGIVYLDVDDEITSAAQRIRSAPGTKVALVVPYGSRIATSRMNFRLLSREAVVSNRRLSIVSGDAASRSLAASAGLPVFGSVGEYESSLSGTLAPDRAGPTSRSPTAPDSGSATSDGGPPADADAAVGADADDAGVRTADGTGDGVAGPMAAAAFPSGIAASETVAKPAAIPPTLAAAAPPDRIGRKSQRPKRPPADTTTAIPVVSPSPAVDARARDESGPRPAEEVDTRLPPVLGGRVRAPVLAAIGLVALAVVVVAVAGYLFLPSASVAITPRREVIGPIELTVSADPEATAVDVANSLVPAIRLEVPVEASRTFETTGTHVEESAARGSVTFTNYDTSSGVSIPSGSVVSTEGGVRFRTQQTVALQPASVFPSFEPTSGATGVVAVRDGEAGNVPANTIRVVPQGQDPVLLRVNNPAQTSGGTHTETPEVKQAEVDKALAALTKDLQAAFDDAVASGAGAPIGTTVFPDTKQLGAVTPSVDTAALVGQAVETFDLTLSATGTVVAVDPSPVRSIAEADLASEVKSGFRLVEGSANIEVGEGTVGEDGEVTFQATARASQVAIVDAAAIPALVKGRTAAEAKAALVPFGDATVTLWPDWVNTVTSVDARLNVTVDEPAVAAPTSSGGPRPSGAPLASRQPGASASPGPSDEVSPSASPSSAAP